MSMNAGPCAFFRPNIDRILFASIDANVSPPGEPSMHRVLDNRIGKHVLIFVESEGFAINVCNYWLFDAYLSTRVTL